MIWPFGDIRPFSYDLICADPPWDFKLYSAKGQGKSAQKHYSCMSLADIKALPVGQLAAPDCCLFLWATWPMLPQAMDLTSSRP
jgi:N6-adenosine-specific RNA methylase IME4